MAKNQSWESCMYGVASSMKGECEYELDRIGLAEFYNCECVEVINMKKFPTRQIMESDGSFKYVARLHQNFTAGEVLTKEKSRLEKTTLLALAVSCKDCHSFKNKTSDQFALFL